MQKRQKRKHLYTPRGENMRDHFCPVGREFKRGGNRVALVMVTLYSCLLKGLGIMVLTLFPPHQSSGGEERARGRQKLGICPW